MAEGLSWTEARGGTRDDRPDEGKPYSAASYAAQYGIPREDAEDLITEFSSHGEIRLAIYQKYLSDEDFRYSSVNLVTRPFGGWSEDEKRQYDIQMTTEGHAHEMTEYLSRNQVKDFSGDMGL